MSTPAQESRKLRGIRRAMVGLAVLTTGTTFISIPSCQGLLTTVNPCGTVFAFCSAEQLDAILSPTPNFNLDPTCSIPFFGVLNAGASEVGTCSEINVLENASVPQGGT